MLTAVLLAIPGTRLDGVGLGGLIVVAAALTVLRKREFGHLIPLGVFAAILAATAAIANV